MLKKFIKERKGTTLVECLVGMVIALLVSGTIFLSLVTAQTVLMRGDNIEQKNQTNVETQAERTSITADPTLDPGAVKVGSAVTISAGGYAFSGEFYAQVDPDANTEFTTFRVIPNTGDLRDIPNMP